MNSPKVLLIATLASAVVFAAHIVRAEDQADQALIKSMGGAKISLEQGLGASQRDGQPISGKFEMEDGKLQLSIYTAKDGKYFEVIVDHAAGTIAKVEAITQGDDLVHAKSQSAAMAKAQVQLKDAVDKAMAQGSDARAVSVTPDMKDGHAVATIVLLRDQKLQTVTQRLD